MGGLVELRFCQASRILFGFGEEVERSGQEENSGDDYGGNAHPYSLAYGASRRRYLVKAMPTSSWLRGERVESWPKVKPFQRV